jgi:hypothetical protein
MYKAFYPEPIKVIYSLGEGLIAVFTGRSNGTKIILFRCLKSASQRY